MVVSRSFFQMISRQPSHLSHRPSVRTVRGASSGGAGLFESESRLNQDIEEGCELSGVRVPSQYCKRPVYLLGQYGPREFVRHGQGREREQKVGALTPGGG